MTLTAAQLADALGYFANDAITAMHNGAADVACIAQGLGAVACRLAEISKEEPKPRAGVTVSEAGPVGEAVADEGWQPIETAPTGGKFGCFLMLAFGPPGDQTVSEGMHFQGRFYAVSVFYTGGPHDTKQFTFREHEVKPTHWRHTLAAPGTARPVWEPGVVERLTRERDDAVARYASAVKDAAEQRALAERRRVTIFQYMNDEKLHAAEAALADERKVVLEIVAAAGKRADDHDIIQHVRDLAETRERLEKERDRGFNHGYLMAVANIINLHRETVVAADVLLQIDLTIDDAESFELAEYDMEALNRLRAEPRAADFFKRQRRAALTGDAQEARR